MKLQTKLFIALMTGLLTVYLASSLFQRHSNLSVIDGFSQQCKAKELERHWQWVTCLQQSITTSLEKIMSLGDMDLFSETIREQASLPGLLEASLADHKGHIAYSTVPERLHQELPAELKSQLLATPALFKRQTTNAFEIYKPLVAEKNCIACHTERRQGDVIGILSLRFSDEGLRTAEQTWDVFHDGFSRKNAAIAAITTVFLLVIIGVLVGVCVHYLLVIPLKRTAAVMSNQAGEVTDASGQVSAASQTLAEGSSEQAASIEETSASLEEMSSMTKRNAENAQKANDLARQTRAAADKGAADMQTMSVAMEAIKVSSDDIAKIIKTIDEIAFQTNILALNAAVEAARAGEAGLGFAVVADEVRNLAQRSAQAAKETADKIEGAIGKTAQGVGISKQVANTLNDIVVQIRQMDELIAEVTGASKEQTLGITQINSAVGQMDKVTQGNAANAEECAAAAEALNSQAEVMKQSVAELLQLVDGKGGQSHIATNSSASQPENSLEPRITAAKSALKLNGHDNHHGKIKVAADSRNNDALVNNATRQRNAIPLAGDLKDF
jgi:hypothetical protein